MLLKFNAIITKIQSFNYHFTYKIYDFRSWSPTQRTHCAIFKLSRFPRFSCSITDYDYKLNDMWWSTKCTAIYGRCTVLICNCVTFAASTKRLYQFITSGEAVDSSIKWQTTKSTFPVRLD